MILRPISLLDCLVFVLCLVPQLLLQVGIFSTLKCIAEVLPFILLGLPFKLLVTDILTPRRHRNPYHSTIPFFNAVVIHCVRYAFAYLPAHIGAVFLSKPVALPFARWRMLRHGYWPFTHPSLAPPTLAERLGFKHPFEHFTEVPIPQPVRSSSGPSGGDGTKGLFIIRDPSRAPDIVVYYLHGGGFAMGSPWFYLEFLLAWGDLLISSSEPRDENKDEDKKRGYANPAIFALDYSLVPHATFPTQVQQVVAGYEYVCGLAQNENVPIELAGDSAGATLALSLMLHLACLRRAERKNSESMVNGETQLRTPDHATLISAWCRLLSPLDQNNASDYLNAESLHLYAREYMNIERKTETLPRIDHSVEPRLASPAEFGDADVWREAIPDGGIHFIHGAEEVLAPETRALAKRLEGIKKGCTTVTEQKNHIHAWPVVDLFLAGDENIRLRGLRRVVSTMKEMLHVWEQGRR